MSMLICESGAPHVRTGVLVLLFVRLGNRSLLARSGLYLSTHACEFICPMCI